VHVGQQVYERIRQLRPVAALGAASEQSAHAHEFRIQIFDRSRQGRRLDTGRAKLERGIAKQNLRLTRRPGLAEELGGDVGNLVRLVENHGFGTRQQVAEALVLERKIREQQVVIDDDHVGRLRSAAGIDDMAAPELRALLTQAIFARRRDRRPERGLFGQVGKFR